jgi:hypothetical protein
VTFGNGTFVAVSLDGTQQVMTSVDGVNWQLQTTPNSGWTAITYGGGLFVAVSESGFAGSQWIMSSPDGITWTTRTPPMPDGQRWSAVTYGNGTFVATSDTNRQIGATTFADATHRVMYSTNGVNWFYGTGAPLNGWFSVTYGVGSDNVGRFVAVSYGGSDRIMTSTDGITWAVVTDPASKTLGVSDWWYAVGYGGGRFLAATYGSNKVMSSTDGLIWQEETAFANTWRSVAYGSDTFVVVSEDGAGPRVERYGVVQPEAPTALSSTLGPESVTIAFTPGAANGAAITNYAYSLDGGLTYILLNPADASSPITITGLTGGEIYTIMLKAVNSFGMSVPSEPLVITALGPAPTLTTVAGDEGSTVGGTQLTLTGTGFDADTVVLVGGEPCLAVVVVSDTSLTCTTPAGTLGVTDVEVLNSDGQSAVLVGAFTYVLPAEAPTSLTAEPGAESVTIAFTPGVANGATITNYAYSLDGGVTFITLTPADATSPITITGLSAGSTYNIVVRAITSLGYSLSSDPIIVTIAAAATNQSDTENPNSIPTQIPGPALPPGANLSPPTAASPPTPTRIDAGKGPNQNGLNPLALLLALIVMAVTTRIRTLISLH